MKTSFVVKMGVGKTIASVITGWNLAAGTIEKCKLTDRFFFLSAPNSACVLDGSARVWRESMY